MLEKNMVCKMNIGNKSLHKFKDKKINLKNWHISFTQLLNAEIGMFSFKVYQKWKVYSKITFCIPLRTSNINIQDPYVKRKYELFSITKAQATFPKKSIF